MNEEQIQLVRKLNDLKNKILNSDDRETIVLYIKEAIKLSQMIQPRIIKRLDGSEYRYEKGKQAGIDFLYFDIEHLDKNEDAEISILRNGVVISLIKLMLAYSDKGIDQINGLIEVA